MLVVLGQYIFQVAWEFNWKHIRLGSPSYLLPHWTHVAKTDFNPHLSWSPRPNRWLHRAKASTTWGSSWPSTRRGLLEIQVDTVMRQTEREPGGTRRWRYDETHSIYILYWRWFNILEQMRTTQDAMSVLSASFSLLHDIFDIGSKAQTLWSRLTPLPGMWCTKFPSFGTHNGIAYQATAGFSIGWNAMRIDDPGKESALWRCTTITLNCAAILL